MKHENRRQFLKTSLKFCAFLGALPFVKLFSGKEQNVSAAPKKARYYKKLAG